jgi:hypothetical protein
MDSLNRWRALAAAAACSLPWAAPVQAQVPMEMRAANFAKADANNDGFLDRKEFATTPRAQPPADPDEVFEVSDLNHDGKVSKAEFLDPNFGALPKPPESPKEPPPPSPPR